MSVDANGEPNATADHGGHLDVMVEITGTTTLIRMNRPGRRDAVDGPMAAALRAEGAAGVPIVAREGVAGAARFADGAGRHGASADAGP